MHTGQVIQTYPINRKETIFHLATLPRIHNLGTLSHVFMHRGAANALNSQEGKGEIRVIEREKDHSIPFSGEIGCPGFSERVHIHI